MSNVDAILTVLNCLHGGVDVVVVTLSVLNQTGVGSDTVNIVTDLAVLVQNHTVLHSGNLGLVGLLNGRIDHLAVSVELVGTGGQQAVGILLADTVGAVLDSSALGVDVVVVTLSILNQTGIDSNTVLSVDSLVAVHIDTVQVLQEHAVGIEDEPLVTDVGGDGNLRDAGVDVDTIDKVLLAVQSIPAGGQLLTSPVTNQTGAVADQSRSSQSIVGKDVSDAVDFDSAVNSLAVLSTVVNVAVGLNPADLNLAVNIVVGAVAVSAGVQTINGSVEGVAGSRNHSAPVDHRAATCVSVTLSTQILNRATSTANTEGTVLITGLGAGGSLALSSAGSADVEAPLTLLVGIGVVTVHFCLNDSLICGEGHGAAIGIGNNTGLSADDQTIISGAIGVPHGVGSQDPVLILLGRVIGNVILTDTAVIHPALCHPNADGQLCQNVGIDNFRTGAGKGNDRIVVAVYIVLSSEAISDFHAFQFPIINIIQVNGSGNGINACQVISNQVHPVQRTGGQQTGSSGNLQTDSTLLSLDNDLTSDVAGVALQVADLHDDGVNAIVQVQLRHGNHAAGGNGNILVQQHAVNINLHRIEIQTGSIQLGGVLISLCLQGDGVGVKGLTVQLSSLIELTGTQAGEVGILTVDGCIRIVNGDIVNVEGDLLIVVVVALAGGVVAVDLQIFEGRVGIQNLPAEIEPAAVANAGVVAHHIRDLGISRSGSSILLQEAGTNLHGIGHQLCGNIHPQTNTGCIGQIHSLSQEDLHLTVAGCGNIGPVNVHAHGVVAILDLAVAAVYLIHLGGDIRTNGGVLAGSEPTVAKILVGTGVADEPAVGLALGGIHLGLHVNKELAVLVIINDFRCLTELDVSGDGILSIAANHSSQSTALDIGVGGSGEDVAIDGTHGGIGQGEHDVISLGSNSVTTLVGGNIQAQHSVFAVGQHQSFLLEADLGHNDGDGTLADNLTVPNHLSGDLAFLTVGGEHAVLDGTEAVISQLPFNISRNIGRSTNQVGTDGIELHSSTGGVVVSVSSDLSADELTGSGSGGDDQNAVGGGTLSTVGGRAVQSQLLTGTLGQEGGGTAAVTVDSLHAAQAQHELSHLVAVEAGGEGGLTTVVHNHDDGAIGLDTHEGAGSSIRDMIFFVLILAVLDQEAEVGRNDLLFPTGDLGGSSTDLSLGHIGGTSHAVLLVEVDDQTGLSAGGLTVTVDEQVAIHDQITQRLAVQLGMLGVVGGIVPAQGQVHGSDNVAVAIGLCISSLLGHDLHAIALVLQTLEHTLEAGHDLGVRIVDVDLNNVSHLTVGTSVVVQHDLGLKDAGSELVVILADDLVVGVFTLDIVDTGGKDCHGNHAQHHAQAQQKSYYLGETDVHFAFSF